MTELLTIILPFYNEEGWIGPTVESLAAQHDQRFRLLLVDNASDDAGSAEAAQAARTLGPRAAITICSTPGKTNAMAHGLALVETPLVAICDADTHYPPNYVQNILRLFADDPLAAAVMAIDLYAPEADPGSRKRADFILRKSQRFSSKCHAGGYAQAFCTELLRKAGGFDSKIWPYVLEDHEIMHRVHRYGHSVYHPEHVCFPSERRTSRDCVSWTRLERLMYRYMPDRAMDWFLYRFLAGRFAARKKLAVALRAKQWDSKAPAASSVSASDLNH